MGLVQFYLDKGANEMKCETHVMYPLEYVLLNFSVELLQHLIYNEYTIMGFLHIEYEKSSIAVEAFEEVESS